MSILRDDIANLDYRRIAQGDPSLLAALPDTAISRRRAVVRDFPSSTQGHYELGSLLGKIAEFTGERELTDEGILECKIAAGLQPEWDAPAVEPAIILANCKAYEETLREVDWARTHLPSETPHLRFSAGYVLMMLSRHAEALQPFELILEVRPNYALAVLYAARCAFALGQMQKGIGLAKTARRLGEPGAFLAWKRGEYSAGRRKRSNNPGT